MNGGYGGYYQFEIWPGYAYGSQKNNLQASVLFIALS